MKYALLVVGFVIAATPTMIRGVWDGQSLFGLIIVLGGFAFFLFAGIVLGRML